MAKLHELVGISFCLCLFMLVDVSDAGECCSQYVDILGRKQGAIWCDVYCCGLPATGFSCCSQQLIRAPDHYRDNFCVQWFFNSANIWAPIVVGVILLAIIISCIVCCVRCCCY